MAYDTFARSYIVDVETCPIDDAAAFIEDKDPPSNWVDPVKITKFRQEARVEALERAGLDLDLARIVAIGLVPFQSVQEAANEGGVLAPAFSVTLCQTEQTERDVLDGLRPILEGNRLITFNGQKFDLPLLARRFLYLGLPPLSIDLDRYRSPHIDLYERLSLRGQASAHKLSWYVKRLGWTDCDSALTGADVAQAVREGRWEDVTAHCEADLRATGRLAVWMGLHRTLPSLRRDDLPTGEPVV